MKNLTYKIVENSKNNFGEGGNYPGGGSGQLSRELIDAQVTLAKEFGCTHFAFHGPMDTDVQMQANYELYGSNYNLQTVEQYNLEWVQAIHAQGLKVVHRGTFCNIKGNNGFPYVPYNTDTAIPTGTVSSAPTDGETTWAGKMWRYLSQDIGAANWETGDIFAPLTEMTEFLSDITGTCTFSSITPITVSKSGYSGNNGRNKMVNFSTTGTLPAPLVPNHVYWSERISDGSFYVLDSKGGSRITGTTSGSGTHSVLSIRQWFADTGSGATVSYKDFFSIMQDVATAYFSSIGKTVPYMTFNLASEVRSGWIPQALYTKQQIISADYYGHYQADSGRNNEPSNYVSDWITIRNGTYTGLPVFQSETGGIWDDSWPRIEAFPTAQIRRITTYEDDAHYQLQLYRAHRDSLINPGLMVGFNNWGMWTAQNSSLLYWENNAYKPNVYLQIYGAFIKGDGMARIPVPNTEVQRDSFGNRSVSY